jgi:hypothetical protein
VRKQAKACTNKVRLSGKNLNICLLLILILILMNGTYDKSKYTTKKIGEYCRKKYAMQYYKEKYKAGQYYKNEYKNESIKIKHINKRIKDSKLGGFRKIYNNIIGRINNVLNDNCLTFHRNYEEILGCTYEELEQYIIDKLALDMTFENYGKWEIDHIIPISVFDFNKYNDEIDNNISRCFHYSNLQPLWMPENREKSNKIYYYD